MPSQLIHDLLDVFDMLAGGVHAGFRPVHAKGQMYSGIFAPSREATKLTQAPHAAGPSTLNDLPGRASTNHDDVH